MPKDEVWLKNIVIPEELVPKLDAYRTRRRVENGGKVVQYKTAVMELLAAALSEEPEVAAPSYKEIVARLDAHDEDIGKLKRKVFPHKERRGSPYEPQGLPKGKGLRP
jgi:hypothetical protein